MQVAATDDDEHSHATTLFRSMAHTGRPLKCKKNISGLRNQSQKSINTPNDALAGWQRSESPRSNSDSESEALDDACHQENALSGIRANGCTISILRTIAVTEDYS